MYTFARGFLTSDLNCILLPHAIIIVSPDLKTRIAKKWNNPNLIIYYFGEIIVCAQGNWWGRCLLFFGKRIKYKRILSVICRNFESSLRIVSIKKWYGTCIHCKITSKLNRFAGNWRSGYPTMPVFASGKAPL
jgi:hypothetical protein